MSGFIEFAIALARIILGLFVLLEGLVLLIFIEHISATSGIYRDKIEESYEEGYEEGYLQAYDDGYSEAYEAVYDKGFAWAYEIGLETGSDAWMMPPRIVALKNPTHLEMKQLLEDDDTDAWQYITGEYVCSDFAADLSRRAANEGIRVAYVRIRARSWGHSLVAFDTVDKGLVFVDPQTDKEVNLVIGEAYSWHLIGAVSPLGWFDPVMEVQVIW